MIFETLAPLQIIFLSPEMVIFWGEVR